MRIGTAVLVGICVVLAPVALLCLGILLKLGIQQSLHLYGGFFTLLLCFGVIPALVMFGFLLDRRDQQNQNSQEDFRPDGR